MNRLVEAARAYNDTPFRHRGRSKRGIDCAGLIWAAYNDCGVVLIKPEDIPRYGKEPHRDGLVRYVIAALGEPVHVEPVRMQDLQEADVLIMRFEHEPHHMAMVGRHPLGHLSMIHADGNQGQLSRVLEIGLDDKRVALITHVFRKPL